MPQYNLDASGFIGLEGPLQLTPVGTASVLTALSDASDATYCTVPTTSYASVYEVADPSSPVGRLCSIGLYARALRTAGTSGVRVRADAATAAWQLVHGPHVQANAGAITDYQLLAEQGADPDALAALGAVLPGNLLLSFLESGPASEGRIYKAQVRLYYLRPVSVSAPSAPSGTVTTTQKPTLTAPLALEVEAWQLAGPSGSFLCGGDVEYRVYRAADAPGSEPPVGVSPVWSGFKRLTEETVGARTPSVSAACGTALENGQYKLYVRASRDLMAGSRLYWSAWASATWTQAIALPNAPALAAAADDAGQQVGITVTGTATTGYEPATAHAEVQRQVAGEWIPVRGLDPVALALGSPQLVGYDHEAARGASNSYRARVSMYHAVDAVTRYSAWTTQAAAGPAASGWNLKTVEDSGSSWLAAPVSTGPPEADQGEATVFRPLGRTRPVVVFGTTSGAGGSLEVTADGADEIAAAEALREYRGLVLLETAFGDAKYIAVTGMSWVRHGTAGAPRRAYAIQYAEVACDLEAEA